MRLSRFYQIVDHSQWLERLLPLGLKFVQLRIKDKEPDYIYQQVKYCMQLCRDWQCQLVLNDYWDIALELNCNYIHLGQEDLNVADMNRIRKAGIQVGISTHSLSELDVALSYDADYIALGPIYQTTLKAMKWAPQGVDKILQWKKIIGDRPLVAIGGISVERANAVYQAGADCISVVTDVLYHTHPEQRFVTWMYHSGCSRAN